MALSFLCCPARKWTDARMDGSDGDDHCKSNVRRPSLRKRAETDKKLVNRGNNCRCNKCKCTEERDATAASPTASSLRIVFHRACLCPSLPRLGRLSIDYEHLWDLVIALAFYTVLHISLELR